jgi:hypothetical protein
MSVDIANRDESLQDCENGNFELAQLYWNISCKTDTSDYLKMCYENGQV